MSYVIPTLVTDLGKLQIACLYAFVNRITRSTFVRLADIVGFDKRNMSKLVKEFSEAGVVRAYFYHGSYPEDYVLSSDALRLDALLYVYSEHPEWLDVYCKACLMDANAPLGDYNRLAKAMATQSPAEGLNWNANGLLEAFAPYALDPRFCGYAGSMDLKTFSSFFKKTVDCLIDYGLPDEDNCTATMLAGRTITDAAVREELEDCLALFRYYQCGEFRNPQVHANVYSYLLHAVHTMHQADHKLADTYFQKALKLHNAGVDADEKNFFPHALASYFLVLNYAKMNADRYFTKMEQLSRKPALLRSSEVAFVVKPLLNFLIDPKTTPDQYYIVKLTGPDASPLAHAFGFFYANYFEKDLDDKKKFYNNPPALDILRHEMQAYLNIPVKERERLNSLYGQPLLSSFHRTQEWEMVLQKLERTYTGGSAAPGSAPASTRTIYIVDGDEVDIKEQKRLKSGGWSVGKLQSAYNFGVGGSANDTEADKALRLKLKNYYSYYRPKLSLVLPYLVDADQLYVAGRLNLEPVKVMAEKPYMVVEDVAGGFKLTSNILPKRGEKLIENDKHVIIRRTKLLYVVITLSAKQKTLFSDLLSIGTFPPEAKPQLERLFPRMAADVEIHSSLVEGGSTLEQVEGDDAVTVMVRPDRQCFVVRYCVRPLAGGKQLLVPGKGQKLIVDERPDGTRLQVVRKLKQERANLQQLSSFVEDELQTELSDVTTNFTPGQLLELVDFAQQSEGRLLLEWPEGECLRLKHPQAGGGWNVALRANNGWFDVEGDVKLDDDSVLSMGQLLDLLNSSQGNYVRLGDGEYLQLSRNLRRQLERIEALATKNHGKMQISQFQASLLGDDVLKGELQIEADGKLADLRKKIEESAGMNPDQPRQLMADLRDYQLEGFRWMARLNAWGAGACLADDMGLGKTVQTISYLLFRAKEGPSLVVAPASVVPNWRREIERFAPSLSVAVLNSSASRQLVVNEAAAHHVVLATYGMLVSEDELLQGKHWNVVCLDEAHAIKNRTTKTSDSAMKLVADCRVILTGTPIQNHLGELWNLFRFINPGLLGSYEQFQNKFINPIEVNHDKNRQQQLNRMVHPFMLRRTKQEVVQELPDKQETIIPVELSEDEMAVYEVIRSRAKEMAEADGANVSMNTLAEITRLRQAACCASLAEKKWKGGCSKIDALMGLVDELNASGNKALVFSQFTSFLALAKKALDDAGIPYLSLDGSVSMKQREKLVEEFQQGDVQFFLISLKAGGLGLNLTAANYIIHLDPWWNPAIEQQATDRAYRIGQKQKVSVYRLIAQHTIEDKILRLHDAKRNMADALLEGTDLSAKMSAKDMVQMLEDSI